jgi:hypothetical protein
MTKQDLKRKTRLTGGLENCRVIEIGIADFAQCVQQGQPTCSHALPVGYASLCMHPRVNEIIENSKRAQQAVKI